MKIYVRDVNTIYETTAHNPFMYKDIMYCTVERKKEYRTNDRPYQTHIVHVLTGQFIAYCKSKKAKDCIKHLEEIEKICNRTVADALTEAFGDDPNANINADKWNKLITRLEK